MTPAGAPSINAMKRMGEDFTESDSDSVAMVVLEGQQPLGDDAHKYYDRLLRQLKDDPKHVQHVQDLWGDPLTAAGVQSADAKAAYVRLNLAVASEAADENEPDGVFMRTGSPDHLFGIS